MLETIPVELNANEVWRVIKALEQALEILHADLDPADQEDPASDPVYRAYLEVYERFKTISDLLPEPDIDDVAEENED